MSTNRERKAAVHKEASRLLQGREFQKSPDPPTEKRIHNAVLERIDREPHIKTPSPLSSFLSSTIRPIPSAALAAAALVVALLTALTLVPGIRGPGGDGTVEVHLRFHAPGAEEVVVVGDWNGWDPQSQILQDENNDGIWEIQFRVEPEGEYQYQFIVDGNQWLPDPDSWLHVPDGFGGTNSVLDLSADGGAI